MRNEFNFEFGFIRKHRKQILTYVLVAALVLPTVYEPIIVNAAPVEQELSTQENIVGLIDKEDKASLGEVGTEVELEEDVETPTESETDIQNLTESETDIEFLGASDSALDIEAPDVTETEVEQLSANGLSQDSIDVVSPEKALELIEENAPEDARLGGQAEIKKSDYPQYTEIKKTSSNAGKITSSRILNSKTSWNAKASENAPGPYGKYSEEHSILTYGEDGKLLLQREADKISSRFAASGDAKGEKDGLSTDTRWNNSLVQKLSHNAVFQFGEDNFNKSEKGQNSEVSIFRTKVNASGNVAAEDGTHFVEETKSIFVKNSVSSNANYKASGNADGNSNQSLSDKINSFFGLNREYEYSDVKQSDGSETTENTRFSFEIYGLQDYLTTQKTSGDSNTSLDIGNSKSISNLANNLYDNVKNLVDSWAKGTADDDSDEPDEETAPLDDARAEEGFLGSIFARFTDSSTAGQVNYQASGAVKGKATGDAGNGNAHDYNFSFGWKLSLSGDVDDSSSQSRDKSYASVQKLYNKIVSATEQFWNSVTSLISIGKKDEAYSLTPEDAYEDPNATTEQAEENFQNAAGNVAKLEADVPAGEKVATKAKISENAYPDYVYIHKTSENAGHEHVSTKQINKTSWNALADEDGTKLRGSQTVTDSEYTYQVDGETTFHTTGHKLDGSYSTSGNATTSEGDLNTKQSWDRKFTEKVSNNARESYEEDSFNKKSQNIANNIFLLKDKIETSGNANGHYINETKQIVERKATSSNATYKASGNADGNSSQSQKEVENDSYRANTIFEYTDRNNSDGSEVTGKTLFNFELLGVQNLLTTQKTSGNSETELDTVKSKQISELTSNLYNQVQEIISGWLRGSQDDETITPVNATATIEDEHAVDGFLGTALTNFVDKTVGGIINFSAKGNVKGKASGDAGNGNSHDYTYNIGWKLSLSGNVDGEASDSRDRTYASVQNVYNKIVQVTEDFWNSMKSLFAGEQPGENPGGDGDEENPGENPGDDSGEGIPVTQTGISVILTNNSFSLDTYATDIPAYIRAYLIMSDGTKKAINTADLEVTIPTVTHPGFAYITVKYQEFTEEVQIAVYTADIAKFNVTFRYNDGVTADYTAEISDGGRIGAPDSPVREGYSFAGWYLGNARWDFDNQIDSDVTLNAYWMPVALNNEICVAEIPAQAYTGKAITPAPVVMDSRGELLTLGQDYKVSYSNNTNAGTATVLVKGYKNYVGEVRADFVIEKLSIDDASVATTQFVSRVAGKSYTPQVKVVLDGKTLKKNADYTLTIADATSGTSIGGESINADGKYVITVAGNGNYSGNAQVQIEISSTKKSFESAKVTLKKAKYIYDGQEHKPDIGDVAVSVGGKKLTTEQFEVSYVGDAVGIGEAYVVITPTDEAYFGQKKIPYSIVGKPISKARVTMSANKVPYSGYAHTDIISSVTYKVASEEEAQALNTLKGRTDLHKGSLLTLTYGVDYSLSYLSSVSSGKKTIVIYGRGFFTGETKKSYQISACKLSTSNTTVNVSSVEVNADGAIPALSVNVMVGDSNIKLVEGRDFKAVYKNNKVVSTASKKASVTISGMGNYSGKVTAAFEVVPKSLLSGDIEIRVINPAYKKSQKTYKPTVKIYDNGTLINAKNYSVEVIKNITQTDYLADPAATGEITISRGKLSNYDIPEEGITLTYSVASQKLSANMIVPPANKTYTGKQITLSAEEIQTNLVYGRDYVITQYKNNVGVGTATVTIEGRGDYSGSLTLKFKITARG